jgi:hypothetical protein
MAGQIYKTAQGKMLDMRSLALKNEQERAVGNMNVNARGDVIDDQSRVIRTKPQQVENQYNNQVKKPRG